MLLVWRKLGGWGECKGREAALREATGRGTWVGHVGKGCAQGSGCLGPAHGTRLTWYELNIIVRAQSLVLVSLLSSGLMASPISTRKTAT